MTTPKLASKVCTYVCWETSKLQVVGAPCWLGTLPSVLLGVRNRLFFSQISPKMLKMASESFIHALLLFLSLFLKMSRWVPLSIAQSASAPYFYLHNEFG